MRKIVLLLLAAAGMTTAAYADQKISGRVTYSGDDSPLIGVNPWVGVQALLPTLTVILYSPLATT